MPISNPESGYYAGGSESARDIPADLANLLSRVGTDLSAAEAVQRYVLAAKERAGTWDRLGYLVNEGAALGYSRPTDTVRAWSKDGRRAPAVALVVIARLWDDLDFGDFIRTEPERSLRERIAALEETVESLTTVPVNRAAVDARRQGGASAGED